MRVGLWSPPTRPIRRRRRRRRSDPTFAAYAEKWLKAKVSGELGPKAGIATRTAELYESQLRVHLTPFAQHIPGGFQATVERYGEHIGKNLPFTYCEVAAGFYIRVFRVGGEDGVRVRALQRALAIGATHNRYPVADQIRDLLWRIDDSTSAKLAADAIRNEATSPWYDHPQLYARELHPEIRAAMQVRVAT